MKILVVLTFACLGPLAGCPADDGSDPDPGRSPADPTLTGPDYTLLGDREFVVVDWVDESTGKCTPLDPCETEAFVIDQVTCDGCTLEVALPGGEGRWVPAQGTMSSGTLSTRLTTQTSGEKTLRVSVRTINRAPEIAKTLELRLLVDRVTGISGACHTGPYQEQDFQIKVTPCAAVQVAGDSLYVRPTLVTASGKTLTAAMHTAGIEMLPAPGRRASVQLEVNTLAVDLGVYQSPTPALRQVALTGTFVGQTFTANVALPPAE